MTSPILNLQNCSQLERLADFLFEAGMLRKTPRTGYQFLGSGQENVAEHSFRTAIIGYVLARLAGANSSHTALICLFHDFAEARTGDFNYVNRMYNQSNPRAALVHATFNTGLEKELLELWDELCAEKTLESQLAHDADQLDLILNLKEELDLGNPYAAKWLESSLKRLSTKAAKELAEVIIQTDHTHWWYGGPDKNWWTNGNKENKS